MSFLSTPDEAQTIARIIIDKYTKSGFKVKIEESLDDANYCTTLICSKNKVDTLIETQASPIIDTSLENFSHWLNAQKRNCEFYIATDINAATNGAFFVRLKKLGIGLIFVDKDSKSVEINLEAVNPALTVSIPPQLNLRKLKTKVVEHLNTFNSGDRKTGLSELSEIVEGLTRDLILKAIAKGKMTITASNVDGMDWAQQINCLHSPKQHVDQTKVTIAEAVKNELHVFRESRNLVKHNPRTHQEKIRRDNQLPDKMMLGFRLVADLQQIISAIR